MVFNKKEELFSEERLLNLMKNSKTTTSRQLVNDIELEIKKFTKGAEQSDDITILAVTYNGRNIV